MPAFRDPSSNLDSFFRLFCDATQPLLGSAQMHAFWNVWLQVTPSFAQTHVLRGLGPRRTCLVRPCQLAYFFLLANSSTAWLPKAVNYYCHALLLTYAHHDACACEQMLRMGKDPPSPQRYVGLPFFSPSRHTYLVVITAHVMPKHQLSACVWIPYHAIATYRR